MEKLITREEAYEVGYCKYCAAYGPRGWGCGVTLATDDPRRGYCRMDEETRERFRGERGLDGATKRHTRPKFGTMHYFGRHKKLNEELGISED